MEEQNRNTGEQTVNQDTTNHSAQETNQLVEEACEIEQPEPPLNEEEIKQSEADKKLAELNDRYLRLYSEFENFRRRTAKERVEFAQMAGKEFFLALLPIIDDFERALKSMQTATDVNAVKEGVELIYNKLIKTLQSKGLEPMQTLNTPFDADLHEAITNVPATDETQKGKVMDELEKGYYLNGKVIRFAKVVVGN
jgi:molecular chaperone GrpE